MQPATQPLDCPAPQVALASWRPLWLPHVVQLPQRRPRRSSRERHRQAGHLADPLRTQTCPVLPPTPNPNPPLPHPLCTHLVGGEPPREHRQLLRPPPGVAALQQAAVGGGDGQGADGGRRGGQEGRGQEDVLAEGRVALHQGRAAVEGLLHPGHKVAAGGAEAAETAPDASRAPGGEVRGRAPASRQAGRQPPAPGRQAGRQAGWLATHRLSW